MSERPGHPRDLLRWELALGQGRLPVCRGLELDADDILRGHVIQQLMCQGEIDVAAVEKRYYLDFVDYFAAALDRLQRLVDDGLVTIESGRIAATSRGRLLLRIIAMCFDRYLQPAPPDQRSRHSRVI